MLSLTVKQWTQIRKQLKEEYHWKPSVLMIRELGFTTRYHKEYQEQTGYVETIYIDFYNDAAESYFRLKYL
jgi:hypothetical protein